MPSIESLKEVVDDLEKRIGVPPGTLGELSGGDDWAFVVRSHAFLEAVVNHLLTASTDQRLEELISHMPLGGRTGKLAFVDRLGLLGPPSIRVLRRLSDLRNTIVHRIENVKFSFATFMITADLQARHQLVADLTSHYPSYAEELEKGGYTLFIKHAQQIVYFAFTTVFVEAYLRLNPDSGSFDQEMSVLGAAFGITLIANELSSGDTGEAGADPVYDDV